MGIFVVIAQPDPNTKRLGAEISARFPTSHRVVASGTWLVASPDSVEDVSKTLGVTDGENGSAIVAEIAAYWGRATPNVWHWIKTQWEATTPRDRA